MSATTTNTPAGSPPMIDEADIGSGEKTPAQKETEEMIRQIPPLPADVDAKSPANATPPAQPATPSPSTDEAPPDQPGITSPS